MHSPLHLRPSADIGPSGSTLASDLQPRLAPVKKLLLLALFIAHCAWTAFFLVPGYLSVDEGTYHLMARNFAVRGDLEIDNGYRELASRELLLGSVEVNRGRIVAVPPPIFPVLAYPFYRLAGWSGVFWLSTLAFAGVILLTFWCARELLGDADVAFDATLILALATYLWPYSQAAWPHALTTLLVLGSFALALATDRDGDAAVSIRAVAAGVVLGLATGVRVDAFFALPAVLYTAFVRSRSRPRSVVGVLAGLTPILGGLTLANLSKFGVMSPFAYTSTPQGTLAVRSYLVPAAILALLAGLTLIGRARRADGQPLVSKWTLGAVLAIAVLAGSLVPAARTGAVRLSSGLAQLVVDLRLRPLDIQEPGLLRSESGAMVYAGTFKKSLLQSCAYLPICLLPFLLAARKREGAGTWLPLAIAPVTYLGLYGWFAWHGGFSFNLRYLLPILPFTSILAAAALRSLAPTTRTSRLAVIVVALAAGATYAVLASRLDDPQALEWIYLDVPLILAVATAALTAAWALVGGPTRTLLSTAARGSVAAGLVWSGLVAFLYDYPAERRIRAFNLRTGTQAAQVIEKSSLLFVSHPDPFFPLIEAEGVRIAMPHRDEFRDFARLLRHYESQGRPIYGAFPAKTWAEIESAGRLEGRRTEILGASPRMTVAKILPLAH